MQWVMSGMPSRGENVGSGECTLAESNRGLRAKREGATNGVNGLKWGVVNTGCARACESCAVSWPARPVPGTVYGRQGRQARFAAAAKKPLQKDPDAASRV